MEGLEQRRTAESSLLSYKTKRRYGAIQEQVFPSSRPPTLPPPQPTDLEVSHTPSAPARCLSIIWLESSPDVLQPICRMKHGALVALCGVCLLAGCAFASPAAQLGGFAGLNLGGLLGGILGKIGGMIGDNGERASGVFQAGHCLYKVVELGLGSEQRPLPPTQPCCLLSASSCVPRTLQVASFRTTSRTTPPAKPSWRTPTSPAFLPTPPEAAGREWQS